MPCYMIVRFTVNLKYGAQTWVEEKKINKKNCKAIKPAKIGHGHKMKHFVLVFVRDLEK